MIPIVDIDAVSAMPKPSSRSFVFCCRPLPLWKAGLPFLRNPAKAFCEPDEAFLEPAELSSNRTKLSSNRPKLSSNRPSFPRTGQGFLRSGRSFLEPAKLSSNRPKLPRITGPTACTSLHIYAGGEGHIHRRQNHRHFLQGTDAGFHVGLGFLTRTVFFFWSLFPSKKEKNTSMQIS